MNIAIIGGGAAGFFSAIVAKENYPDARVVIFEKSQKLLSKVKISGGGRCNVTNGCDSIDELCKAYPRGGRSLKKAFYIFNNKHAVEWFESRGVPLVIQDDNRVFPASQSSQSIIDCFLHEADRLGIEIETGTGVKATNPVNNKLQIDFIKAEHQPAILKLSAFGARILSESGYNFKIQVNWVSEQNSDLVSEHLKNISGEHSNKLLSNYRPYALQARLWLYFTEKCDLPENKHWGELGKKGLNKLVNVMTHDEYAVKGRTTFKEEFVTSGGISLESVDLNTMQSKVCKNLYFAGEILDIDAVTGGSNFQAAWTTGYIAGKLM